MSTLPLNRPAVQPASLWPAWTDEVRYEIPCDEGYDDAPPSDDDFAWVAEHMGFPQAHDDAPGEPMLPFAEWVRVKASLIRRDGTDAAAWLAREMDRLAEMAEALGATTPDQFDGRREANEDCQQANAMDRGYRQGYADARSVPEEMAWKL